MSRFFLLAITLAAPSMVSAQASADSSVVDSTGVGIAPVTVTATRQAISIFETPMAVTVVGRQAMENKRGYSLDDAVANVPGVLAQSRYGASDIRITIRGFGARGAGDRSNAGTSRGIRVLIDGIPETEPDGRTSFDLVDLAAASRVEVIRSNASALWGNAGGGVIAISTVPELDAAFISAQQMAGGFGFLRTVLQAGAKLGASTLAVTFTNTMQEGYREHSDSRRALVNASVTSPLGKDTDVGVFVAAANDLFHIPGPLTRAQAEQTPRAANSTYAARDERRFNRLGRIGVSLRHSIGEISSVSGMLYLNPKILQRSERGTFRDFNRHHLGGNLLYRTSYRLASAIPTTTTVGVDRANQSGSVLFYSLTESGTRGSELRDNRSEGAANTGVFFSQAFGLASRTGVEIGARWDQIRYDYRDFINPTLDDARSFSRVSPKVGINYRFADTHSLYANVGGGVEAPAGNETDPASTFGQDTVRGINPLLEPIHSTTWEIGTRQSIPMKGFFSFAAYDVALYNTNVTNEIVPYRGGRFYFSAGSVRRQGAELSASLLGRSDLEIAGSTTLSRNRYLDYTVDSVHYGAPGRFADYSGNSVAGVPGRYFSASLRRAIISSIPIVAQVNVRGVGKHYVDDANGVSVPAWRTYGAGLRTSRALPFGRLAISAFVNLENITDTRYIGSAFVNPDVVNGVPVAFEPGAGRAFLFSVSVRPR